MRRIGNFILKILPFAITAALIVFILLSGKEPSVDAILSRLPDNLALAWLLLLLMYAVKSLSIIFPIIALQIAAGIIFPFWSALILNIIGTAVTYTIPYMIGRFSGASAAERLMQKHPKIREIVHFQRNSDWFISFILRAVSCLPGDIVSMYLGSIGISYVPYVIASVVGTLPGLIPATLVGLNFMNPKSPEFIVSVIVTIAASVASVIIYYFMKKRYEKK